MTDTKERDMTEKRRAPESVCRELAAAVDVYWDGHGKSHRDGLLQVEQKLAAYRAATAPLRTRASVDAEIAQRVRKLHAHCDPEECSEPDLLRLCSEPTAGDHGSSSTPAAKESRDNAGVSAGPTNEPLEDPEPCGCDQAEHLKRKLADIRVECEARVQHKKSSGDALYAILEILDGP